MNNLSKMKHLIIDGELSGTGIRDKYAREYGYLDPKSLHLSDALITQIQQWQNAYELMHFNGYNDKITITKLDAEGIEIAKKVARELSDTKVEYYSGAFLKILFA